MDHVRKFSTVWIDKCITSRTVIKIIKNYSFWTLRYIHFQTTSLKTSQYSIIIIGCFSLLHHKLFYIEISIYKWLLVSGHDYPQMIKNNLPGTGSPLNVISTKCVAASCGTKDAINFWSPRLFTKLVTWPPFTSISRLPDPAFEPSTENNIL